MHSLFEVSAKLSGIYFVYLGLMSAVGTAITTAESLRQDPLTSSVFVVFNVALALVQLMLGSVLFSKTPWVCRLARLPERDLPALNLDGALPLGLALSGVVILGQGRRAAFLQTCSCSFLGSLLTPPRACAASGFIC